MCVCNRKTSRLTVSKILVVNENGRTAADNIPRITLLCGWEKSFFYHPHLLIFQKQLTFLFPSLIQSLGIDHSGLSLPAYSKGFYNIHTPHVSSHVSIHPLSVYDLASCFVF